MMLAAKLGRISLQVPGKRSVRFSSSIPSLLYSNIWRKSTVLYITYVLAGCVVLEGIYGTATGMLWDASNAGVNQSFLSRRTID
jgi:hypothetical protein